MSNAEKNPFLTVASGDACMDAASIGALLGCTKHHVWHHLAKRVDFPPLLIDFGPRGRYWRAVDVLAWLNKASGRALRLEDLHAPRLDTAGIANLLGCTRQHAADNIAKRADFPPPCIDVSSRMRFWLYRDVLAWLGSSTSINAGQLLDAEGVATLLGCPRCHVVDIARRADFPVPFLYASRRLRWWLASDVQAWLRAASVGQKGIKGAGNAR